MAGYRKDAIFVQLLLFHIAVYPIMLNPNTKGSTRRARNNAKSLAWVFLGQHRTSKKHPSEGFGRPQKRPK